MPSLEQEFLSQVQPLWERLHAVARQYTSTPQDGQDLVQETLLRAWKSYAASSACPRQAAWFFAILRNVALEWRRKVSAKLRLKIDRDVELTSLLAPDPGDPFARLPAVSEREFREFLDDQTAAAFDSLEAPFREVLVLSAAGDLNYREISQILDCPMGTVMSRMARARRYMRERLAHLAVSTRKSQEARL